MEVHTARFGIVNVARDEIIQFDEGILGFEGIARYILLPHGKDSPFMFLQAIDDENLAFVVIDPTHFWPTYQVEIGSADLNGLGLDGSDERVKNQRVGQGGDLEQYDVVDDTVVLAIVTVPADAKDMTANLLAPLVINPRNGKAKQVVQRDSAYSTRHKIVDALKRLEGEEPRGNSKPQMSRPKLVQVG